MTGTHTHTYTAKDFLLVLFRHFHTVHKKRTTESLNRFCCLILPSFMIIQPLSQTSGHFTDLQSKAKPLLELMQNLSLCPNHHIMLCITRAETSGHKITRTKQPNSAKKKDYNLYKVIFQLFSSFI